MDAALHNTATGLEQQRFRVPPVRQYLSEKLGRKDIFSHGMEGHVVFTAGSKKVAILAGDILTVLPTREDIDWKRREDRDEETHAQISLAKKYADENGYCTCKDECCCIPEEGDGTIVSDAKLLEICENWPLQKLARLRFDMLRLRISKGNDVFNMIGEHSKRRGEAARAASQSRPKKKSWVFGRH